MVQLISVVSYNDRYENLGIARIEAFLSEKGINIKTSELYLDKNIEDEFCKIDLSNGLFGFTAYSMNIDYIQAFCRKIKENNKKAVTFVGGRYAFLCADLILEKCADIDFVVLGHGEYPILDVIEKIKQGKTVDEIAADNKHIQTRNSKDEKEECFLDVNSLPWPTRNYLINNRQFWHAYICDAHGCTGKCSFCTYHRKYYSRTPKDIMNEIIDIYNKTGIRIFFFMGGSFEDPGKKGKQKIEELCKLLLDFPIRFTLRCYIRAESFRNNEEDYKLLELMGLAGFCSVFVGIEAANNEDLQVYCKRSTVEDNYNIFNMLDKVGINHSSYGFIMFNPYSNVDRLAQNYEFLIRHKCLYLEKYWSRLRVCYNTPIYHTLKKENLLIGDYSLDWHSFRFIDNEAKEIFDFLAEHFIDIQYQIEYHNNIEFMYLMNNLINIEDLIQEYNSYLSPLFNETKNFFHNVFVEKDLDLCRKMYPDFMNAIKKCDNNCKKVTKQVFMKVMRLQLHHEKVDIRVG